MAAVKHERTLFFLYCFVVKTKANTKVFLKLKYLDPSLWNLMGFWKWFLSFWNNFHDKSVQLFPFLTFIVFLGKKISHILLQINCYKYSTQHSLPIKLFAWKRTKVQAGTELGQDLDQLWLGLIRDLFVYLSIWLSVYMSMCIFLYLSICLSAICLYFLPVHLSLCLSVHLVYIFSLSYLSPLSCLIEFQGPSNPCGSGKLAHFTHKYSRSARNLPNFS